MIAGGRNKGLDFNEISSLISEKVSFAILFGESRKEIKSIWESKISCFETEFLEDALKYAKNKIMNSGTILFSPACTSFDQFNNYKERGSFFKELVVQS